MQAIGNSTLVDYGIQTEGSSLRAHVCVIVQRIYVYPTACGIQAIKTGKYTARPVYTGAIQTATGYAVPWNEIPRCVSVGVPNWLMSRAAFDEDDTTTKKGEKAVWLCKTMLEFGAFPLPSMPEVIDDTRLQIEGTDIIITMNARIQVKCDYRGGAKEHGGTGNLFLQTAECNPYRAH